MCVCVRPKKNLNLNNLEKNKRIKSSKKEDILKSEEHSFNNNDKQHIFLDFYLNLCLNNLQHHQH